MGGSGRCEVVTSLYSIDGDSIKVTYAAIKQFLPSLA